MCGTLVKLCRYNKFARRVDTPNLYLVRWNLQTSFLAHMKVYKPWWKVFIMVINIMHLANVERLCAAKIEKVTFNRLLTIKL